MTDSPTPGPSEGAGSAAREMERVRRASRHLLFREPAPTLGDRYELGKEIGRGGRGVVYRAFDNRLKRQVAIKLVRLDARGAADQQRLIREAHTLARLSHPNIVPVFDVGRSGGEDYIAMEFIDGMSLQAWIDERPRAWRECLQLFDQLAAALCAAHNTGLVHGDVKPQNAMIDRQGRLFVLDFGFARAPGASTTEPSTPEVLTYTMTQMGGTGGFMPPEQYARHIDHRTDQFAFCVSLFRALYARAPFDADAETIDLEALRHQPIERSHGVRGVPGWLRAVILRGMAAEPSGRFSTMTELRANLKPPRRRLVPLLAALVSSLVLGAWTFRGTPRECQFEDAALTGVWDDGVETAIVARAPSGFETQRIVAALTAYADEWSDTRARSCVAHREDKITDALYELRMACLETSRAQLGYLITQVLAPTFREWTLLDDAVQDLTGQQCDNDSALLAGRPTVGVDWDVSHEIDDGLAEAAVEMTLGRPARHLDRLLALEQEVHGKASAPAVESLLVNALGEALNRRGRFTEAESRLRPATLEARRFGYWIEAEALLLGTLSQSLAEQPGRHREAVLVAEQALATADGNDRGRSHRARLLSSLAIAQRSAGQINEALQSVDASLAAPSPPMAARGRTGEREQAVFRAGCLNLRALLLESLRRGPEAETAWRDALQLLDASGVESLEQAQVLNNLGVFLRTSGHAEEALLLLLRAAEVKARVGELHQAASTLMNAANVHLAANRPEAALPIYDRALALLAIDPDARTETLLHMNRALAFADLNRSADELSEWDLALSRADPSDADRRHAIFYRRGRLLLELGETARAANDLRDALALESDRTTAEERVRVRLLLAQSSGPDNARASEYAVEAAELAEAAGMSSLALEATALSRAPARSPRGP